MIHRTAKSSLRRLPSEAKILVARAILFVEQLWPSLLATLGTMSLFVLISLFDLWKYVPWLLHYAALFGLVMVSVYFLVHDLGDLEWPSRGAALERLEKDGRVPHAPLQALADKPFFEADNTNPLWHAHKQRMARMAKRASLDMPRSLVDRRDPYALRYGVVLLLAFAIFTAWGNLGARLVDGVSPKPRGTIPSTVDLWIDPPDYTGRAPIVLVQSATLEAGAKTQISVPEGAIVYVRIGGNTAPRLFGLGGPRLELDMPDHKTTPKFNRTNGTLLAQVALTQNNALNLRVDGKVASWPVQVVPDTPPAIRFRDIPDTTDENHVRVIVEVEDDYGVVDAELVMLLVPDQELPLDVPALDKTKIAARQIIPITGITGVLGPRSVELDLTDNEWAGLETNFRIVVRDGAGQSAETLTEIVALPQKEFFNPLARAIIHERRNLVIAPSSWVKTSQALAALTFAPDHFFSKPKDYLLLRAAYWDVIEKKGSYTEETVEIFWPLALQLEDEALELARRTLDAAQTALREALEHGASPAEIKKLIEDLRLAMQNYIQALAESGQADADGSGNSEQLGAKDLNDILDSINDLSQSGANNAARQMLSELEQMLQNLQISQSGSGSSDAGQSSGQQSGDGSGEGQNGSQNGSSGGRAMGEAGDMIGSQRELADDTFNAQRRQYGLDGGGGTEKSNRTLENEQGALAGRMEKLLQDLEGGISGDGSESITRSFEQALEKMEQATEALSADNPSAASLLQEEALDALRDGADGLAEQQLAAQEGLEDGTQGTGGTDGSFSGDGADLDPLGRPFGAAIGEAIGIPDLSDPEAARELILELRRRLSEPGRSREEIEYLERLLERF